MAAHEWMISLRGAPLLLQELAHLFPAGDPTITASGGYGVMKSRRLDGIDRANTVHGEAELLIARAASVVNLYMHRTGEVEVENALCFACEQRHGSSGYFEAAILVVSETEDERMARDLAALASGTSDQLLALASTDDRVAEVLAVIGSAEPQWPAIYTALEAIARDLKQGAPGKPAQWGVRAERGWASEKLLDNIKQTSNSHRHARGYPLPQRPVSLEEARSTMKTVVRKWLQEKLTR
jgi:hypothetical protein